VNVNVFTTPLVASTVGCWNRSSSTLIDDLLAAHRGRRERGDTRSDHHGHPEGEHI
jgi:hypothetical protein